MACDPSVVRSGSPLNGKNAPTSPDFNLARLEISGLYSTFLGEHLSLWPRCVDNPDPITSLSFRSTRVTSSIFPTQSAQLDSEQRAVETGVRHPASPEASDEDSTEELAAEARLKVKALLEELRILREDMKKSKQEENLARERMRVSWEEVEKLRQKGQLVVEAFKRDLVLALIMVERRRQEVTEALDEAQQQIADTMEGLQMDPPSTTAATLLAKPLFAPGI
ncbi:hypothetical protein C8R43DRAFT_1140922 [Mycena crocata]|nr:hypothetical protein C8R43DRAFT_1140922 [Mycena crocata]